MSSVQPFTEPSSPLPEQLPVIKSMHDTEFPLSAERAGMVEEHMNLAFALVSKYRGRRQYPTYDDLTQEACLGLVYAAGRFDKDYGASFETFAAETIRGCIKRAFRDGRIIRSRKVSDNYQAVEQAGEEFHRQTGRPPTHDELVEITGLSSYVIQAVHEINNVTSLDTPAGGGDGTFTRADLIAADSPSPEESVVSRLSVEQGLSKLPEVRQTVIRRRYLDEDYPTQAEVAEPLGISQVHAGRHEQKALMALRELLAEELRQA